VIARLPLVVWVGALVALAAYVLLDSGWRTTHGFIAYYAASRLLVTGGLGPAVYDDAWFMRIVQEITGTGVLEVFGPNAPTVALAALPIAWLDHATARWIWLTASLVAFAGTTGVWLRSPVTSPTPVPAPLIALLMLAPPVWANLRTGQIYLFVFAAVAAAAYALIARRDGRGGFALGLALTIKSAGAAWLTLLLAERRIRAVVTALFTMACLSAMVMNVTGAAIWQRYPGYVQEFVQRPGTSVTAYQTTWGFARHLCVADPQWNPAPVASCAGLANLVPPILILGALIITANAVRRAPPALAAAAGICLSVLAVPVAGDHHFVVLGLAMLLLWQQRATRPDHGARRRGVWVVLGVLYALPMEWTAFRFTEGWSALAAYPRLYSAWLLWALIIRASRAPKA
jgi:hypothetical protein